MQFDNKAQEECYGRVGTWIRELFGEQFEAQTDRPQYWVKFGSASVSIAVYPWGDANSVVSVSCWLVTGTELSREFLHYLLEKNNDMRFGAFVLDGDGDVCFRHRIVGNTCDKVELETSIKAVGFTADKLDDEIVSRWGGQRMYDRSRQA